MNIDTTTLISQPRVLPPSPSILCHLRLNTTQQMNTDADDECELLRLLADGERKPGIVWINLGGSSISRMVTHGLHRLPGRKIRVESSHQFEK